MRTSFNIAILTAGVFCCSTSVIFIKATSQSALVIAAWRLSVAALVLAPLMFREQRRATDVSLGARFRMSLWPGLILAVHFVSWAYGARLTPAANATLITNMVPIVMPLLLLLMTREVLTRREAVGTGVALIGFFLIVVSDLNISARYFWGDVVCFVSMLLFALYLAMARKNRAADQLWLYVVPLYVIAAFVCIGLCFVFDNPIHVYPASDVLWMTCLGIVSTVFGHSILNRSMHVLSAQVVSIFTMVQFFFAAIMALIFFGEVPALAFYPASVLFIAGGWIAAFSGPRRPPA
ncbi:MAG: drug/metabolite transporter (DMT)-like permease [Candidatus Promineifilaceae bacterium]|jgi:drug/metabolite transporter (DMT)-like permease